MSLFLIPLCLAPWACTNKFPFSPVPSFPVIPTPTSTPAMTPTPDLTPVCCFTSVTVPFPALSTLSGAPKPLYLGASVLVVRSLADWQTYCGTTTPPAPPVDFSAQMMLVAAGGWICGQAPSFVSVCEGPTQVAVSIRGPAMPDCFVVYNGTVAVAVDQSALPVVWNVIPGYVP